MSSTVFHSTDLLIPEASLLPKWAVIACDQFTSEPEYWEAVKAEVGDAPSALNLIFPEAWLKQDRDARIAFINESMRDALHRAIFRAYPGAFVYVERTLADGSIRRGVVGAVDLDDYDYTPDAHSAIRATERTVVARIPPRVAIRKDAPLELPHVLMLCDDEQETLIETLTAEKDALPVLYDFDLMQGGGHIIGRLVTGEAGKRLEARIAAYEQRMKEKYAAMGVSPILYAVGDGNHSLATAKECWEAVRRDRPEQAEGHPARCAMVELENIRDAAQRFEPIHRIVMGVDPQKLMDELTSVCASGGYPIRVISADSESLFFLNPNLGELPVAILQRFLDETVDADRIDYIHGDDTATRLGKQPGTVAFLLPGIPKDGLFPGIAMDGVLPRKTFSMGHAQEKRYYLECRRIQPDEA
ncbi:MAG: DUF1015 domain-containing protein [Clostridia bacterium]|nr:DUF1015 domain-containing protein [Clostridia bacterium]